MAGNLILIPVVLLALYGLVEVLRGKRALAGLGMIALGAVLGYLVQAADGERLQRLLAPAPVVEPNPLVAQQAPTSQPENSAPEQPRRTAAPDPATTHEAEPRAHEPAANPVVARREVEPPVSAPPAAVTPRETDPAPPAVVARREAEPTPAAPPAAASRREADPPARVEGGGVRIVVEGSWGAASDVAVESAIRQALRGAEWDGLHSGGRKVLRVRGSLEDIDFTLGQIPTASATLSWSLESASGAVMAEGGFADLRGTGPNDAAARAAALRRAAGRVASELSP